MGGSITLFFLLPFRFSDHQAFLVIIIQRMVEEILRYLNKVLLKCGDNQRDINIKSNLDPDDAINSLLVWTMCISYAASPSHSERLNEKDDI